MRLLPLAFAAFGLVSSALAQTYTIQTFAGGVLPENITGVSASLGNVSGVAVDQAGNVLLALSDYNLVLHLDSASGMLTRVAGNGTRGFGGDGGAAPSAELAGPAGITIDSAGNLYIADAGNHRIRMVANGTITTVAGNGTRGYSGDGGPATSAQLDGASDVAVDSSGNLYIADFYNQAVRKVANGTITTAAGNGSYGYGGDGGPATQAQLGGPLGIVVDSAGSLYISEAYNQTVRRVANGVITTVAGMGVAGFTGDGNKATRATLRQPIGLAMSAAGNLYIVDSGNNRIRMVSSGGTITTIAGNGTTASTGDNTAATGAGLGAPQRVAVDASGNVYVTDSGRVRKVARGLAATLIRTVAGGGSLVGEGGAALSAQIVTPQGLALDAAGNMYVSDAGAGRVLKVANGMLTRVAGTAAGQLGSPSGIALDGTGALFIADNLNCRILKMSGATVTTVAGGGTAFGDDGLATRALLTNPQGVAVDAAGELYLVDLDRVRMVSKGTITTVAGNGGDGYQGDNGPATAAMLSSPTGVAVSATGDYYIADTVNNRVRMVSNGVITTVAGNGTNDFTGYNATATSAAVGMPAGVAVDSNGDLYITDARRILKVSKGKVTTLGGLAGAQGIAVDTAGRVYVADPSSHRVSVLTPAGTVCAVTVAAPAVSPVAGGPVALAVKTGTGLRMGGGKPAQLDLGRRRSVRRRARESNPHAGPERRCAALCHGSDRRPECRGRPGRDDDNRGPGNISRQPPAGRHNIIERRGDCTHRFRRLFHVLRPGLQRLVCGHPHAGRIHLQPRKPDFHERDSESHGELHG
jgi:sugar lactone lactonase YvrE